jgi:hypothetical protein
MNRVLIKYNIIRIKDKSIHNTSIIIEILFDNLLII